MKPTFSFAINQPDSAHQSVVALITHHHQLGADGAPPEELAANERAIRAAISRLKPSHRNPAWLVLILWGEAHLSFGALDDAISYARQSLEHAGDDPEFVSKSHNNLCEYHRQKGEYEAAVKHGEIACRVSGGKNLGMLITWAMALYMQGDKTKAETILSAVAKVSQINAPGDVLGTHLRFEGALCEMTDLPTVKQLLSELK